MYATDTSAGSDAAQGSTSLLEGWNLISYPSAIEIDINSSSLQNYTLFGYYNSSWLGYVPNRPINPLQTFKPGFGYWVKVK